MPRPLPEPSGRDAAARLPPRGKWLLAFFALRIFTALMSLAVLGTVLWRAIGQQAR